MTEETSLLQRAQQRDPTALAQIYDIYAPQIYAYIYRHVVDAQRAEDLTASVFLKALEALERHRFAHDSIRPWLYRIAYNTIIDDIRQLQRRPSTGLNESIQAAPDESPEMAVQKRLENERLFHALSHLTADQRDVLILRFGEGLTAIETAQILDKTEEAVRGLQRRGLASLRRKLASPTVLAERGS